MVQNNLRVRVAFQLDDNPHPVTVGFIAHVGNCSSAFLARSAYSNHARLVDQ
jgi:hypothetical protein